MNPLNYAAYTEQTKPADFSFTMEGAGCCIIVDGKVLLLQRSSHHKIQPGTWGIPAGKLEMGETPAQAAVRELQEEAGIVLDPDVMQYRGYLYITVEYAVPLNYRFHVYVVQLQELPDVILEPDQVAFCWATYDDALKLPGFTGAREVLALGMSV
jgi:mutator protein MutT